MLVSVRSQPNRLLLTLPVDCDHSLTSSDTSLQPQTSWNERCTTRLDGGASG
jgi:hypothetical protein